jgi:hypothetical protein
VRRYEELIGEGRRGGAARGAPGGHCRGRLGGCCSVHAARARLLYLRRKQEEGEEKRREGKEKKNARKK